jgi:hypothetical protein
VLLDTGSVELTCSDGGDINYVIHFELYLDYVLAGIASMMMTPSVSYARKVVATTFRLNPGAK